MRIILAAVLVMAAFWFDVHPAAAGHRHWQRPVAPWCAVYSLGWSGPVWDCRYPTLKACVPFVIAGTRGFCNPNPAYPGPVPEQLRRNPYRHR